MPNMFCSILQLCGGEIQIKRIVLFRGNFLITAWARVGAQQPQRGEQLEQGGEDEILKRPFSLSKNGSRKLASFLGELKNLPPEESITSIISLWARVLAQSFKWHVIASKCAKTIKNRCQDYSCEQSIRLIDPRHSFNIHLLGLHAASALLTSEGIKWKGRLTHRHLDTWGNASNNERWYICLHTVWKGSSHGGENMAAGGFGRLNLAACGTDISNDSIFAWKQHLRRRRRL